MAHIEGLIEEASIIKRGPNYFLELKVDAEKVYINEWVPVPEQKNPEMQYKKTGVFRTHFGQFLPEDIMKLKGQVLNCEARPHKELANAYFFTTNVVFTPPAISEESLAEIKEVIETKTETPVEQPKETPAPTGRIKCPDCHIFISKTKPHICKAEAKESPKVE